MESKYFVFGILFIVFCALAGFGALTYFSAAKAPAGLGAQQALGAQQKQGQLPAQQGALPQGAKQQAQPPSNQPPGQLGQQTPPVQQKMPNQTNGTKANQAKPSALPAPNASTLLGRPKNLQLGLNFIRFYWDDRQSTGLNRETPYVQPSAIFSDFSSIGAQGYRQLVKADLLWGNVEPANGQWNFEAPDAVITNPDYEPIADLFSMQYASATPPWAKSPSEFQKTVGADARDYLTTVVKRYAPYVKYWEIGNEMDHWRAATESGGAQQAAEKLPDARPADGFSPQEQGVFLAQAAEIIRENDPDAVIVMPGMSSPDDYCVNTWLPGVVEGGGKDWFDIVNYHYYTSWERYPLMRPLLGNQTAKLGISSKPVWLTETGATSDSTLTVRTDYPNSEESQAEDVFRRIVQAYGQGDAYVSWHTYIGNDEAGSNWRGYGMKSENGSAKLAYYSYKLLADELVPFAKVETVSANGRGANAYKITTSAGAVKYVAWGNGDYVIPAGMTQMASTVPNSGGNFDWQKVGAGSHITLGEKPVLVK